MGSSSRTNTQRPLRALRRRTEEADDANQGRPVSDTGTHFQIRYDTVDRYGTVTSRYECKPVRHLTLAPIVDAVLLEGRSPTELARSHGISRTWIYALVKRFREGGYPARDPRSRRPRSCPQGARS